MVTVYHPRLWLHQLPAKPRFYTTAAGCTKHTGEAEVISTPYTGPMTAEFIVQPEEINPPAPASAPEAVPEVSTEVPLVSPEASPLGAPVLPAESVETPVPAPKVTSKKSAKKSQA